MVHPILSWIKLNLGDIIRAAVAAAKEKFPDSPLTEDWLAGITCRETGEIIAKHMPGLASVPSGRQLAVISPLMKGDYSQRKGDPANIYHGFGFTQIDIASFPAFVKSGDWQDPGKCYGMSVAILEDDRKWLQEHFPSLTGDALERAITAAYNCGPGGIRDAIEAGADIDSRTTGHDYSKSVWQYREWYKTL